MVPHIIKSIFVISFVLIPIYLSKRGKFENIDKEGPYILYLLWIFLFLFEYFYLGPLSFVYFDDEGELILPYYVFLDTLHEGGQYNHLLASGADAYAAFSVGNQFLSVDRALLSAFPLWIAILIHKAIVCSVGLIGTYKLCRRGVGSDRVTACAFAALFTVGHYRLLQVTFDSGISWSLIPLAIYLCVVRSEKDNYYPPVIGFAVLTAILIVPYQGIWPLFAGLIGSSLLFGKVNTRIVVSILIFMFTIFINWAESIYGMLLISPSSFRGTTIPAFDPSFLSVFLEQIQWVLSIATQFLPFAPISVLLAFSTIVLILRRDPFLFRMIGAYLVPVLLIIGYKVFPWAALGMPTVRHATSEYFLVAWLPFGIVAGAKSVQIVTNYFKASRFQRYRITPVTLVFCIAFGLMGVHKGANIWQHFTSTGQGLYRNIANLKDRSWSPAEPYRVVVVADRIITPRSNIGQAFYGLSLFDGWLSVQTAAHVRFWRFVNRRKPGEYSPAALMYWPMPETVPWDVDNYISLPLLATANVRFIISPIPIKSDELKLVDGPDALPLIYRQKYFKSLDEKLTYYTWYVKRFIEPWKVYIYEIPYALPRV